MINRPMPGMSNLKPPGKERSAKAKGRKPAGVSKAECPAGPVEFGLRGGVLGARLSGMNWWILLGFLAGASLPIQAGANIMLRQSIGSPMAAALVSFTVGTLLLFGICAALRVPWPVMASIKAVPVWAWIAGGFSGALVVTTTIVAAPRIGIALTLVCIIVGQMLVSTVCDHFGAFGVPKQPVNWPKLLGIVLMVGGAALVKLAPSSK